MGSEKTRGSDRTRNWSAVLYPESAPGNWREVIEELHIEWVESPLHEFDSNADGELKKAHWHLLLMFGGVKSFEQVCEVLKPLNCPSPQRCHNAKAMIRYMAHLDNPDKYQYSVGDIKAHGGVDLAELLRPSSSERYSILRDMCDYIRNNGVTEFSDFVYYAMTEHYDDWFPFLADNSAYFIGQVIKSQRCRSGGAANE